MKFVDIYLCVLGSIILALLIKEPLTYLISCAMLGLVLGAIRGSQNGK